MSSLAAKHSPAAHEEKMGAGFSFVVFLGVIITLVWAWFACAVIGKYVIAPMTSFVSSFFNY